MQSPQNRHILNRNGNIILKPETCQIYDTDRVTVQGKWCLESQSIRGGFIDVGPESGFEAKCDLHGKGLRKADNLGFISGNQQVQGGSQQREGGGRRARKLVMWSWFEPGLRRPTDQGLYLAATFYNRVTAVDNSSALSFRVLYKMGK